MFSAFDEVQVFDVRKAIVVGEYYVDVDFFFGRGTIKVSRGWYPLATVLILYALERNAIVPSDIKFCIEASFTLSADTFKSFVEGMIDAFDGAFPKNTSPKIPA